MKNIFIGLLILLNSVAGSAQSTNYAVVKGKMDEYRQGEIILYKAINGEREKCVSFQKTKDRDFSFMVPVKEPGLYYLTDQTKWWYIRLYLKPGDQTELNISHSGKYQIVKGSPENRMLYDWFNIVSAVTLPAFYLNDSITHHDFFTKVNELLPAGKVFQKKIVTNDKQFNRILKQITDIDVEYAALRFCFTPRISRPSMDEYNSFLERFVVPQKYCDAELLKLGECSDLLSLFSNAAMYLKKNAGIATAGSVKEICDLFCNDTIKGAYLVSKFYSYKYYDKFLQDIVPLEHYFVTASLKAQYEEKRKQFNTALAKGSHGLNFSFEDTNGKMVSIADFKGKVVLIDTWATWCKPCLGEMPHLKALEEDFKSKEVVFMGVSFDDNADKQKWKNFVADNKLAGIQLFASGFKNQLSDFYQVNAIPRFIVLDREGKIFDVDAPRPSEPQLKSVLDQALQVTN